MRNIIKWIYQLNVQTIKSKTISSEYRDIGIHQCPPNGPGVTVLIMMKLLQKLKIENYKFDSVERFHLEAEVTKQAYKIKLLMTHNTGKYFIRMKIVKKGEWEQKEFEKSSCLWPRALSQLTS